MPEDPKTPEMSAVPPSVALAVPVAQKIQIKDLLIPGAIIVAGIAIGIGLYFSGGSGASVNKQAVANPQAAPQAADTTDKIDPVTDADHVRGSLSAPVKIVEYSDFECPFCKRHHEVLKAVTEKYGDKVAWVYRQSPIDQLHPVKARAAAMASECVAELGGDAAFWIFTDSYFEETLTNNRTDTDTLIPKLVLKSGVNAKDFSACVESDRHSADIEADLVDANETGGGGTPWTIIIGPSGKTYPVNGALPAAVIEQAIEKALNEA